MEEHRKRKFNHSDTRFFLTEGEKSGIRMVKFALSLLFHMPLLTIFPKK